jgi:TRAP-type transport system periplasmic protein
MKITKLILGTFIVILLMVSTVFCASAAEVTYTGPPIKIRVSSHIAETNIMFKEVYLPWLNLVEKESKGKIKFDKYFSGALHGARDGFKACASDLTDRTNGYPLWQPKSFDLLLITDLPFAFPNAYVGSIVAEKLYPKYFKKEYEKMGVYLGTYITMSAYQLMSKKPIRKLEDFKGLKVRSGGGNVAETFKRLGAAPVMLTTADTYEAFQRGLVDAVSLSDVDFISWRVAELAKYHTQLDLITSGVPYCYNPKTFNNLPPDLKRLLYNMERQHSQLWAAGYEKTSMEAKEDMKKRGIELITLAPSENKRLKEKVQPMWEDFVKEKAALGLPARELLKDMEALKAKYSSWTPEQIMKDVIDNPTHGIIDGM